MKKSDIALLVLIAAFSAGIVYLIANALIGNQTVKPVDVETVKVISADVEKPSVDVFNDKSINPTVPITIGGGNNQNPIGN